MSVSNIIKLAGFTLNTTKFFDLVKAKLADDEEWAGDFEDLTASLSKEKPFYINDRGTGKYLHDLYWGMTYTYPSSAYQDMCKELFPGLPDDVKFYVDPTDHQDNIHIGFELKVVMKDRQKIKSSPVHIKTVKDKLDVILDTYKDFIDNDTPKTFDIPDCCSCCT